MSLANSTTHIVSSTVVATASTSRMEHMFADTLNSAPACVLCEDELAHVQRRPMGLGLGTVTAGLLAILTLAACGF